MSVERKPDDKNGNSKFGLYTARARRKIENLALERGSHVPRMFFVRVADKGVNLDAARKSGRERT